MACPAWPGAVEKTVADGSADARSGVTGDVPAEGICGSGLVDLLGELLRTGHINHLGRFEQGEDRFTLDVRGDNPVYLLPRATSMNSRRLRARMSPGCASSSTITASASMTWTFFYSRRAALNGT